MKEAVLGLPEPQRGGAVRDWRWIIVSVGGGPTGRLTRQGRALVRAIEPSGPFERFVAGLLLAAYKRRLGGLLEKAPGWVVERIVGVSERIGDGRDGVVDE